MNSREKLYKDILVFILFFLIWFCLFRFTGSIAKGYNIFEDNIYITVDRMLDSQSVFSTAKQLISADAEGKHRFRPFWAGHIAFATDLTNADLTLYTFYIIFLGILTSFFLYKFCRIAGFSFIQAFIFGLLILAGRTVIIWSEITDSENIGMFMFSLTLYFLAKSIYSDRFNSLYKIICVFSMIFTALCKESFILVIPAVIFLYIWLFGIKNNLTFTESFKLNKTPVIVFLVSLLFLMTAVVFSVGINNQTYAGIDLKLFGLSLIGNFFSEIIDNEVFYVILGGMLILLIYKLKSSGLVFKLNSGFKNYLNIFIFFILISFPQFILYYKTGLENRYLLPFLIGFYFLLASILKEVYDKEYIPGIVKNFYLIFIAGFIFYEIFFISVPLLNTFSKSCRETSEMVSEIINNSGKGTTILFVMDPVQNYHEVYSLKTFLNSFEMNERYSYDFIKRDYLHPFFSDSALYNRCEKDAYTDLGANLIDSLKNKDSVHCVSVFWSLEDKFLQNNKIWFKEENYRKEYYGSNTLFIKK